MSRRETSLAEANSAAVAQRQRLRQRIDATTARLKPSRLTFDAEQKAEQLISDGAHKAVDQVKAHPVATGFGIAALIAWTFREPLMQHAPPKLRAAYDRLTGHPAFSESNISSDANEAADGTAADDFPPPPPPPGEPQD